MGLGSVTYLQFHQGSHLFSCSEDGTLCLWKTFTWECLRTFKGHKLVIFFHLFDWLANHFDQSSAIWQLLISYDCQELQNIKLQSPLFSAIMVQCNKYVPWSSSLPQGLLGGASGKKNVEILNGVFSSWAGYLHLEDWYNTIFLTMFYLLLIFISLISIINIKSVIAT